VEEIVERTSERIDIQIVSEPVPPKMKEIVELVRSTSAAADR